MKVKIEAEVELTPAVGRYEPADLRTALAAWFKAQYVKVTRLKVSEQNELSRGKKDDSPLFSDW